MLVGADCQLGRVVLVNLGVRLLSRAGSSAAAPADCSSAAQKAAASKAMISAVSEPGKPSTESEDARRRTATRSERVWRSCLWFDSSSRCVDMSSPVSRLGGKCDLDTLTANRKRGRRISGRDSGSFGHLEFSGL